MSSITTLLKKSWGLYKTHAGTLIGYSAWILLPFLGVVLLQPLAETGIGTVLILLFAVIEIFFLVWVEILLLMYIDSVINKREQNPHALHRTSLEKIQPMLVVAILQLIIILGGFILLIIPGLIFFIWYGFSQIAAVLDNKRGLEALNFSRELVQGRFFQTAWKFLGGITIIFLIYSVVLGMIVTLIAFVIGLDPKELLMLPEDQVPLWLDIIEMIGIAVLIPFQLAYMTMLYEDLKSSKVTKYEP